MRQTQPWLIGGITLGADQLTKLLTQASFTSGESLPLWVGWLHLTYVQNTGAAFGLFKGQQLLFIGLSVLVIAWVIRELTSPGPLTRGMRWGSSLILGGATGNLIDRLRCGYVVDFIDVRFHGRTIWPVFNVADSAITIGVTLLMLQTLRASPPAEPSPPRSRL